MAREPRTEIKTCRVDFMELMQSIPDDHPYNDIPIEVAKKKFEAHLVSKYPDNTVFVEWY